MRIVVVGAGGRTGKLIVKALVAKGDTAVATIRKSSQMAALVKLGAEARMLDLVESPFDQWVDAFRQADAVVFAAGSATGEGSALDRTGTHRTLRAAKKAGVERYVSIASLGASTGMRLSGEWATDEMVDYYKQKRAANKAIRASGLDFTIIEPGELTDGKAKGLVTLTTDAVDIGSISRADVAAVTVAVLHNRKSSGKAFQLVSGKTPIDEALAAAVKAR